ncbi:MAG TPA: Sjogren's syndrome/scleroderma autoantigen 1 family protein [Nitrososphaeraceae archaeon]|jgi:uncharacterized Zn finger protein (UPF0148 family)
MSDPSKKESRNNSDFQDAASLLLKGGCLISESCPECSGVQIRFKDDTICVNCGKGDLKRESSTRSELTSSQQGENDYSKTGKDLSTVEKMLIVRIVHLTTQMNNNQTNFLDEIRIAGLIETYVRIVEKIRSL